MRYEVTWRCEVDAAHPLDAVVQARDEIQKLLDSSAPIAFSWESPEARALSVLMPDGSIRTSTSRRM